MSARTHYDPYLDEYAEHGACGKLLGENSKTSNHWLQVNCKLCLKRRADIERSVAFDEENIINQMASMVEFFNNEKEAAGAHI